MDETAGKSIALNQLCIPNCIYEFSTLSIIELDKQLLQSASIHDFRNYHPLRYAHLLP
jgi:hypothetical protein